MKKLIERIFTAGCLLSLAFYAYGVATVEPSPPWTPPQAQICFEIGGAQYCIDIPDELL